jgi:hypothetical protein
MLNKKISHSKAFAEIANTVGCEAALFLTWLIAHLDKEGRVHGDPEVLKGLVCPRIAGIDPAMIRKAAGKAHELGLVEWYEVEGESYISYPHFDGNQVGLRKNREPPSDLPPPSGNLPADCRQPSGNDPDKGKGREHNIREGKKDNAPKKRPAKPADPGVTTVWECWKKYHPDSKFTNNQRALITRRLKSGYTPEDLCQAIRGIHLDPWEDREKYLSLKYALKDESSIEKFQRFDKNPPGKKHHPMFQALADTARREGVINDLPNGIPRAHDSATPLLPPHGEDGS